MAKRISDSEKPRYVIYASARLSQDTYLRQYVPVFTDVDYAKRWLMRMLHGFDWTRQGNWISTGSSLKLRSDQLEDILNAPDSDEPLKPDDFTRVQQFKYGSWEARSSPSYEPEPQGADGTEDTPVDTKPVASKSASRPVKSSKASVPPGYVTITDLAATWGMKASDCRAILRGSNLEKPSYGWCFAEGDIPKIKKLCGVK